MANQPQSVRSWAADNGKGTFTNPLFNDEFSDSDIVRVGSDVHMTGTTTHAMPGQPVPHSRDLVNWTLLGYAFDRSDMGPECRFVDLPNRDWSAWSMLDTKAIGRTTFLSPVPARTARHAAAPCTGRTA